MIFEEGEDDTKSSPATSSPAFNNTFSPRDWKLPSPSSRLLDMHDQVDRAAAEALEASGVLNLIQTFFPTDFPPSFPCAGLQLLERMSQVVQFLRESKSKLGTEHNEKYENMKTERDRAVSQIDKMNKTIAAQGEHIRQLKKAVSTI